MVVRFPDGTVRYDIYYGTSEQSNPALFGSSEEAWDWWGKVRAKEISYDMPPQDAEQDAVEVEVSDGASVWPARATAEWLLPPYGWDDLPGVRYETPPWYPLALS